MHKKCENIVYIGIFCLIMMTKCSFGRVAEYLFKLFKSERVQYSTCVCVCVCVGVCVCVLLNSL